MRTVAIRWMCLAVTAASLFVATTPASAATAAGSDYVFLIDGTGTMRQHERGEATAEQLKAFVDRLSPGDRISVYRYGEAPSSMLATYPMAVAGESSRTSIKEALKFVFNADRTDMTRGLELAWSERQKVFPGWFGDGAERTGRSAFVVLLTDGKLIPVYRSWSQYDQVYSESRKRLLELASLFGDEGVAIHTVGLGPAEKTDGDLLRDIAKRSGGRYYHAPSSDALAGTFSEMTSDIVVGSTGIKPRLLSIFDSARAADSAPTRTAVESSVRPPRTFPGDLHITLWEWSNAAMALLLGFVALGSHKRQSWATHFTRPIGRREIRVKGYLRPVDPPGITSARACIPIENPGLPAVEVGKGTQFANDLRETLVEFIGTDDGTPPVLRYVSGSVKVDGEELLTERKLQDGSTIELERWTYMYLRGSRR